ncbi:three-Cys-motif partner protein TcmP [Archangium primigenium]|uniref:three-Cys-motif partner protein TcmP n=1 Tax=[Archangium] primigenium TaxID=2792470 RepID=UPI00195B9277|nr:three-Cys-motif partner protein TcmP [Archangium primigenium]MBM7112586.1 three-Cys-motif partner protein TcmP [Archangium primigenium]
MNEGAPGDAHYEGREQTLVKHFILRKYLERFALIVGTKWKSITYVDGFSGPWNLKSENFEDSSFAIALEELRKARRVLERNGHELGIRCFFIEKNRQSHTLLKAYTDTIQHAHIETKNAPLEASIGDILSFIEKDRPKTFPFIFIDPKGWTGFSMTTIQPLLQSEPGEVLINFMTSHIKRFITSPLEQSHESFKQLFGSDGFREKLAGRAEQDREDAAVSFYMQCLKRAGKFRHVCCAIVLHPEFDKTHFHLIYATRNAKGVEVFKEVEKKAMQNMEEARATVQKRKQEKQSGQQSSFFQETPLRSSRHYDLLRERYLDKCQRQLKKWLSERSRVSYDDAWAFALMAPMVWESDLREWLDEWSEQGLLTVKNRPPRSRVLARNKGILLEWNGEKVS